MMWLLLLTLQVMAAKNFVVPQGHYLASHCHIFSFEGEIQRTYPGAYCLYVDDGHLISADGQNIRYFDKDMKLIWTSPVGVHHSLEFSKDKKSILALSSEIGPLAGYQVREDVLVKLDKVSGKILKKFKFENLRKQIANDKKFAAQMLQGFPIDGKDQNEIREFTHLNSFREIGENPKSKTHPEFTEGNFIVTSAFRSSGLFFISKEMDQIVGEHHYTDPLKDKNSKTLADAHDGDVDEQGHILLFVNGIQGRTKQRSEAVLFDPILREVKWSYRGDPLKKFYSMCCGGLQKFSPDLFLVMTKEEPPQIHLIDGQGQLIKKIFLKVPNNLVSLVNTKIMRLDRFLKANKGP